MNFGAVVRSPGGLHCSPAVDGEEPIPLAQYVARVAILAAAYFGLAKAGLAFAFANESVTAVWAPTGLSLAALLVWGPRVWPGVLVGAFLANVTTDAPLGSVLGVSVGNTLEALAGAYLLNLVGFDRSLARVRDVVALAVLAAGASTLISATIGVASLYAGGAVAASDLLTTWRVWWLGDMFGDLLVAPLFLVAASRPRLPTRRLAAGEAVMLLVALGAVAALAFRSAELVLPYAVFPPVLWAVFRFGQPGAVVSSALVAGIGVWATSEGSGPFAIGSADDDLLRSQAFAGVLCLTALVLAAVRSEREQAEQRRLEAELSRQAHERAEARFRRLMESMAGAQEVAGFGSWEWGVADDSLEWSDELCRIFGREPGRPPAGLDGFLSQIHEEDRARVRSIVQRALVEQQPFEVDARIAAYGWTRPPLSRPRPGGYGRARARPDDRHRPRRDRVARRGAGAA